jgi:hypothetical protein
MGGVTRTATIMAPWDGGGGRTHLVDLLKAKLRRGVEAAPSPVVACSWRIWEKKPCSVRANNGDAHGRRSLFEGVVTANLLPCTHVLGESQDLVLPYRGVDTSDVIFPLGGIVLE